MDSSAALPDCTDEEKVQRLREALDLDQTQRVAEILRVLGDVTRVRIVWALAREKEVCVSELVLLLEPLTPSAVSHALTTLYKSRLVTRRRAGKVIYYGLDAERIRRLLAEGIANVEAAA